VRGVSGVSSGSGSDTTSAVCIAPRAVPSAMPPMAMATSCVFFDVRKSEPIDWKTKAMHLSKQKSSLVERRLQVHLNKVDSMVHPTGLKTAPLSGESVSTTPHECQRSGVSTEKSHKPQERFPIDADQS
jgi:hypothetical protein